MTKKKKKEIKHVRIINTKKGYWSAFNGKMAYVLENKGDRLLLKIGSFEFTWSNDESIEWLF